MFEDVINQLKSIPDYLIFVHNFDDIGFYATAQFLPYPSTQERYLQWLIPYRYRFVDPVESLRKKTNSKTPQ